jgi:hypothetical protein
MYHVIWNVNFVTPTLIPILSSALKYGGNISFRIFGIYLTNYVTSRIKIAQDFLATAVGCDGQNICLVKGKR